MLTGGQLIGLTTSKKGLKTFKAFNPSSMEILSCEFSEPTQNEIEQCVILSSQAFSSPDFRDRKKRACFLRAVGQEIINLEDILLERCHLETALPFQRLIGERTRTVNQLNMFADLIEEGHYLEPRIDTALPDRQPTAKPDIRQIKIPLGPVAVFGSSNFPLAFSVAGGDSASAWAAGCPVIVKAHFLHPGTSELVGQAVQNAVKKTGMPEGVFSMIHGMSHSIGEILVKHPGISAIGFTGSNSGGRALFNFASQRPEPIPVYAEMGSVNPVFVLPEMLKENGPGIAEGYTNSVTLGAGQFCTNPGLLIVEKKDYFEEFLDNLKCLSADSPNLTMLSTDIRENYLSGIDNLISSKDIKEIVYFPEDKDTHQVKPTFLRISGKEFLHHKSLEEEVFGPGSLIVETASKEEMLNIAERLSGHLTATVWGTEKELLDSKTLIQLLQNKVGRLVINGFPTGVEVCPSMHHGGPYPATTDSKSTSVGTGAVKRFLKPVCYQNFPQSLLPDGLKNANPEGILRLVNGSYTKESI